MKPIVFIGRGLSEYRKIVHEMFIRDYRKDPDGYVAGEPSVAFQGVSLFFRRP
ncbi:hypothetical protein U2150_02150 [Methanothermobacter wolfeii]|uniref:Uncharacterized protein n=1 Tax=Methanothermobacter wolfeii TaxID=145261 RepID=A0A9E7RSC4_METWO|nr:MULTISPECIES: hypothetical protein [Methanothermobacter]NLM03390.1 hypothetical protein [Methanothermobacter wolfeii]UXH31353.1 hypothetical protein N5910_07390 [Methanothermobacter wolfeii]SCM58142.1 hypothetical protein MWSIV6_1463 [Methanothermobacter wolfeii]